MNQSHPPSLGFQEQVVPEETLDDELKSETRSGHLCWVNISAELLGYSYQVAQRHAEVAAEPWSRYVK